LDLPGPVGAGIGPDRQRTGLGTEFRACQGRDFGSAGTGILENEQKWWGNFVYENSPTLFCGLAALTRTDFRKIAFFAGSMPRKRWNLGGGISSFQNTPPKMLIPGFRPGSERRSGTRGGAQGFAGFHFLGNEQKWWGNFVYENSPTLFCGLAALIRPDFRKIAFFAGSMPHKRWNLGGVISSFQNTPPKMLIPGFRPGSERRPRDRGEARRIRAAPAVSAPGPRPFRLLLHGLFRFAPTPRSFPVGSYSAIFPGPLLPRGLSRSAPTPRSFPVGSHSAVFSSRLLPRGLSRLAPTPGSFPVFL
jgi:hypothetical protein